MALSKTFAKKCIFALALLPALTVAQTRDPKPNLQDPLPAAPPADQYPSGVVKLGSGQYFSPYLLLVDKAKRTLTIWQEQNGVLKNVGLYVTDLGRSEGDKKERGDHKTPEGIYFLMQMKEGSELNYSEYGKRAFTTNYPNYFDILEGKTGDGIWLHAVPDTTSLFRGSRGCVVVRNNVILELSRYITPGRTPLLIQDSVTYQPLTVTQNQTQKLMEWLQAWREAWQSKNIEKYMGFYSDDFKTMGMNKRAWQRYKSNLNKAYAQISVDMQDPVILTYKNRLVIRALQEYRSDKHADFGEKTLWVSNENGEFKIVGEDWSAVSPSAVAKSAAN